jgi:hypothetical protein
MQHHIYFSPGMFGFARLASYDYFGHVDRALHKRFRDAGEALETHVSDALPTESVRRRSARLATQVDRTSKGEGLIHLLGHSTGGLDGRLVASPSARLPIAVDALAWLPRLRSVTTMNTPHYGTPLASFFATSKGQRVLYAMSAFTFVGLTLGERPLAAASLLIGILGRGDRAMGLDIRILDKSIDGLLALVDDARSPDVRTYLNAIKADQGSMLQLSPEAMDMMLAGFEDRPGVAYQSTAAMSPTPSPGNWMGTLGHPWSSISLALFTALHAITSHHDRRYPCAAMPRDATDRRPWAGDEAEATLVRALGASPDLHANDGVVPMRSQIWGKLVWAGLGDHLDVLGHYHDKTPEADVAVRHHDWLTSGSAFDDAHFDALMDAIAKGMLEAR